MNVKSKTSREAMNPGSSNPGEVCCPDEVRGLAALLGWGFPIALIVLGSIFETWILWLWIPAFIAMGITCLVNAASCGRVHCYATGPRFLVAAALLGLIGAGALPRDWVGEVGFGVLVGVLLAYGFESLSGRRYATRS
jgi:hypothetical protein